MALEPNKLYGIAQSLAEIAKDVYGEYNFIGFSKIRNICKSDQFAQLLLSRLTTNYELGQLIFITNLILNTANKKEYILKLTKSLYIYTIDFYDDTEPLQGVCKRCGGDGTEKCEDCGGDGLLDCRYCDGEGKHECQECYGEGTEECRYCGGSGTETEIETDDEGDEVEVEVECAICDGEGTERCRGCGGQGGFDCEECDGDGTIRCANCRGEGEYTCYNCEGYGVADTGTGEEKYGIDRRTIVTLGDVFSKYIGKAMLLSDFEEIDGDYDKVPYSFTISSRYFPDEDKPKEERQMDVGLDDDFVEFVDGYKLENYPNEIKL